MTELVSIPYVGLKEENIGGFQGGQEFGSINDNGQLIAYMSYNPLLEEDTNGCPDVYVRNMNQDADEGTARVSTDSDGNEGNQGIPKNNFGTSEPAMMGDLAIANNPSISGNGLWVFFTSNFINLVPNDTNNEMDAFMKQLLTGETRRVSEGNDGEEGLAAVMRGRISTDDRFAVFGSMADDYLTEDTNNENDAFAHNIETKELSRVSTSTNGNQGTNASSALGADFFNK